MAAITGRQARRRQPNKTSPAPKPLPPNHPIPNPQSTLPWPDRLPEQVAILRKLIGTGYDKNVATPDAEALSGLFGRKNKKRTEQIEGILETLKGLGQL